MRATHHGIHISALVLAMALGGLFTGGVAALFDHVDDVSRATAHAQPASTPIDVAISPAHIEVVGVREKAHERVAAAADPTACDDGRGQAVNLHAVKDIVGSILARDRPRCVGTPLGAATPAS